MAPTASPCRSRYAPNPIAEVDVFVPEANRWEVGPPLPTPRAFLSVAHNRNTGALSGGFEGVVVAGGRVAGGQATPIVEELILDELRWVPRTPLAAPRLGHAGVDAVDPEAGLDGETRLWVFGGQRAERLTASAAYYVHRHDYAGAEPELPAGRFAHAAVELDGRVYVFGGRDFQETTEVWIYDPELGTTEETTELPEVQRGLAGVALNGEVLAIGGTNRFGVATPSVRAFDPATRMWRDRAPLRSARSDAAAVVHGGRVYVIGGFNNGALPSVERYDPAANAWEAAPVLPEPRTGAQAVTYGAELLVVGGRGADGALSRSVLRLRDGRWEAVGVEIPVSHAVVGRMGEHQLNVYGGWGADGPSDRIWSVRLSDLAVSAVIDQPGQNLMRGVDRAAGVMHHGSAYVFGGNVNLEPGPSGMPWVQKIDGDCFNGVLDAREVEQGRTPYDRGGRCADMALRRFSGVHTNVPVADLQGWRLCYSGRYDVRAALAPILAACDGERVVMACRVNNGNQYAALAEGSRAAVFQNSAGVVDNGVKWYYSTNRSMGFAPADAAVQLGSCDVAAGFATQRVCWHTSSSDITSGYRCGSNTSTGSAYTRELYTF